MKHAILFIMVLAPFALQSIDVDAQQELAKQWSVRSMPTFLVLGPDGEIELARRSGFMDSHRMAVWLRGVRVKARENLESIVQARKIAERNRAALTPLLQIDPSKDAVQKGQQALYTLLQQRNELAQKTAEELDARLQAIAEKHPDYLAPGILHDDLQVRARIARALANREIHFDPWASKEKREADYAAFIQTAE